MVFRTEATCAVHGGMSEKLNRTSWRTCLARTAWIYVFRVRHSGYIRCEVMSAAWLELWSFFAPDHIWCFALPWFYINHDYWQLAFALLCRNYTTCLRCNTAKSTLRSQSVVFFLSPPTIHPPEFSKRQAQRWIWRVIVAFAYDAHTWLGIRSVSSVLVAIFEMQPLWNPVSINIYLHTLTTISDFI